MLKPRRGDLWTQAGALFSGALFVVSGIFSFTLLETLVAKVFVDQLAIGIAAIAFEGSKAVLWVEGLRARRPVLQAVAVAFALMSIIAASTSVLVKFDRGDAEAAAASAPRRSLEEKRARLLEQRTLEAERLQSTDTAYVKSPEATRAALAALEAEIDSVDEALAALPVSVESAVNSRDQFDALRIFPFLADVDFRRLYALCVAILIDVGAFTSAAATIRRKKLPVAKPLIVETSTQGAHLALPDDIFVDGTVRTLCGRVFGGTVVEKTEQPLCRGCSNRRKIQGGLS